MRILGFEISRAKSISPVDNRGGWWPLIREPYSGAWQNNDELFADSTLAYFAVYACITLISADIGKLRPKLKSLNSDGIWVETKNSKFSPLLVRPNRYQNHIQFKEWWITSKASRGNTYVLKQRDARGAVVALYILDPLRVQPLVADDGSVFYNLGADNLNDLESGTVVPASEIIHDRMCCLFHPLVGIPPIYASGLAANQGLRMQQDSSTFFANGARPGGILTAPGAISDETALRLKTNFEANYSGKNSGRIAVVGDGLTFDPIRATAVDSQFVEQLNFTAQIVCSTYHMPPFKISMGVIPAGQKIEDLNQIYYSDCLQSLIESYELCLDEGLGLPENLCIELDIDGLLRMDTATLYKTLGDGVKGALLAPNEGRKRINMPPIAGGDSVYMQQQNYSLEALAKRDSQEDPFSTTSTPPASGENNDAVELTDQQLEDQARFMALVLEKELSCVEHA